MKYSAPAAQGEQELNQDRQKSKFSKKPHKPKGFNREKILEEIALKWYSKGLYVSPSRAMIALLGDSI
jgi:hypothetical protein